MVMFEVPGKEGMLRVCLCNVIQERIGIRVEVEDRIETFVNCPFSVAISTTTKIKY
jgi:hypothetical protein